MAMSVEQARAIVEREGAAVRLFVNYLNDPGIQFYFQVRIAATTDTVKSARFYAKSVVVRLGSWWSLRRWAGLHEHRLLR